MLLDSSAPAPARRFLLWLRSVRSLPVERQQLVRLLRECQPMFPPSESYSRADDVLYRT